MEKIFSAFSSEDKSRHLYKQLPDLSAEAFCRGGIGLTESVVKSFVRIRSLRLKMIVSCLHLFMIRNAMSNSSIIVSTTYLLRKMYSG